MQRSLLLTGIKHSVLFNPAVLKAISEDSDTVPSLMSEYLQSEGTMCTIETALCSRVLPSLGTSPPIKSEIAYSILR